MTSVKKKLLLVVFCASIGILIYVPNNAFATVYSDIPGPPWPHQQITITPPVNQLDQFATLGGPTVQKGYYLQQVTLNFTNTTGGLVDISVYISLPTGIDCPPSYYCWKLVYDKIFPVLQGLNNYSTPYQFQYPTTNCVGGEICGPYYFFLQLQPTTLGPIQMGGNTCTGCNSHVTQPFGPPPSLIQIYYTNVSQDTYNIYQNLWWTNNAVIIPTGNPSITINPPSGPAETNTLLSGQGFHKASKLNFTYNNAVLPGQPVNTVITSSGGLFNNTNYLIPPSAIGNNNTIRVCDSSNACASTIFNLTPANVQNFASANQNNNSTTITPFITTDTPMLALSQSLYLKNGTLIQTLGYPAPISINTLNHQVALLPFNPYTINAQTQFYENVTLTDAYNLYITKSQNVIFGPVVTSQYINNATTPINPGNYTKQGGNVGNQILSNATYQPANLTPGNQNFSAVNPNSIPIMYQRIDKSPTVTYLLVSYPNNFNLTCNLMYQFAELNKTYVKLPHITLSNGRLQSNFTFTNPNTEIITTNCTDVNTHASAKYILTQTNFPLQQQIQNFRSGQFGTHGQFGVLDVVSLIGILSAMIGLSRVNEAAGITIAVIMLTILSFFQIVTWQTTITGAIATVVMIAIVSTKKLPWSQ